MKNFFHQIYYQVFDFINLASGILARKPLAVIPKRMIKGGYNDATAIFTPSRWQRMPVSEPLKWWQELPLKWQEIMPERVLR